MPTAKFVFALPHLPPDVSQSEIDPSFPSMYTKNFFPFFLVVTGEERKKLPTHPS